LEAEKEDKEGDEEEEGNEKEEEVKGKGKEIVDISDEDEIFTY
jgi:hypothetical protein